MSRDASLVTSPGHKGRGENVPRALLLDLEELNDGRFLGFPDPPGPIVADSLF